MSDSDRFAGIMDEVDEAFASGFDHDIEWWNAFDAVVVEGNRLVGIYGPEWPQMLRDGRLIRDAAGAIVRAPVAIPSPALVEQVVEQATANTLRLEPYHSDIDFPAPPCTAHRAANMTAGSSVAATAVNVLTWCALALAVFFVGVFGLAVIESLPLLFHYLR